MSADAEGPEIVADSDDATDHERIRDEEPEEEHGYDIPEAASPEGVSEPSADEVPHEHVELAFIVYRGKNGVWAATSNLDGPVTVHVPVGMTGTLKAVRLEPEKTAQLGDMKTGCFMVLEDIRGMELSQRVVQGQVQMAQQMQQQMAAQQIMQKMQQDGGKPGPSGLFTP